MKHGLEIDQWKLYDPPDWSYYGVDRGFEAKRSASEARQSVSPASYIKFMLLTFRNLTLMK